MRRDEPAFQLYREEGVAGNAVAVFPVPAKSILHVLYAEVLITTGVDVGDRLVEMTYLDSNGNKVVSWSGGTVVPASSTFAVNFLPSVPRNTVSTGGVILGPIPDRFLLDGGSTLQVAASGGFAGDSFDVKLVADLYSIN